MIRHQSNQFSQSIARSIVSGLFVVETAIALTVANAFISTPSGWIGSNPANAQSEASQQQPDDNSSPSTSAVDLGVPLTVDRSTALPPPPAIANQVDNSVPVPEVVPPTSRLNPDHPSSNTQDVGGPNSEFPGARPIDIHVNPSHRPCYKQDQLTLMCVPLQD